MELLKEKVEPLSSSSSGLVKVSGLGFGMYVLSVRVWGLGFWVSGPAKTSTAHRPAAG